MIARLSSPVEELKDHDEVVVVGSGYGGTIAASRLARSGRQVCLTVISTACLASTLLATCTPSSSNTWR